MIELSKLREQIDIIDEQLMNVYKKRVELVSKVASIKKQQGISIHHADREKIIIDRLIKQFGQDYAQDINAIYPIIMNVSKLRQARVGREQSIEETIQSSNKASRVNDSGLTIATQGVNGSYSTQATKAMFLDCDIKYNKKFSDVFVAVANGEADYGVVPIENSNAGSVSEVYDLLSKHRLYINKAKVLSIQHSLLAPKGATIKDICTVYSHSQALYQSKNFIADNGFCAVEVLNTAQAAQDVAKQNDFSKAAIASAQTADIYGLQILKQNVQDESHNSTRFIAISKDNIIGDNANKISLATVLPHHKGTLLQLLNIIASYGVNMTKIESRPILGSNFEFLFYFDIQGNIGEKHIQEMLFDIYEYAEDTLFLGGYEER